VLSHPGAIAVQTDDGQVTISGNVLPGERAKVEDRMRKTRGVQKCNIQVTEQSPEGVPELQGRSRWQRKTGS
jgi:hypothetical protein